MADFLPGMISIGHGVSFPAGELEFAFSRSGGKGGQNVNKVETKVEVRFDFSRSPSISGEHRARIWSKLANRLDAEGKLLVVADEARTQAANREIAVEKLRKLLHEALKVQKKRRATKPSRASKERRLTSKKVVGRKKEGRRWSPED